MKGRSSMLREGRLMSRCTPRTQHAAAPATPYRKGLNGLMRPRGVLAALVVSAAAVACGGSSTQPSSAGGASKLSFTVQPSNATAGVGIAPAVAIQDASGNTGTNASGAGAVPPGANAG